MSGTHDEHGRRRHEETDKPVGPVPLDADAAVLRAERRHRDRRSHHQPQAAQVEIRST